MGDYTADPSNSPTTFELPDDGDLKPVASINPTLEALADAVAHANWPETDATVSPLLATQSIFRVLPYTATILTSDSNSLVTAKWGIDLDGRAHQVDVAAGYGVDFPLHLPNGAYLQSVFPNLQGAAGHVGLPTMPQARIFQIHNGTGVSTALTSLTNDNAADVAAYEAVHQFTLAVNATVDTTTYRYVCRVIGETGANSIVGLSVVGITVQFRVSNLDKGAS